VRPARLLLDALPRSQLAGGRRRRDRLLRVVQVLHSPVLNQTAQEKNPAPPEVLHFGGAFLFLGE